MKISEGNKNNVHLLEQTFLSRVKAFMAINSVQTEVFEMDDSSIKMEAVTKEIRQELLDAFFRQIFAEVSKICL